jgi:hypothetical protein
MDLLDYRDTIVREESCPSGAMSRREVGEYARANRHLWDLFCRFTFDAIRAGRKRIGAKMIAERIRWETQVLGDGKFKFNNNYTAGFARMFMERYPEHDGVFATRGAASDRREGA